jgi:heme-degrading monooxygenase HmoA
LLPSHFDEDEAAVFRVPDPAYEPLVRVPAIELIGTRPRHEMQRVIERGAGKEGIVIARIWRGVVPTDDAAEYIEYVRRTGIDDYRSKPGSLGAWILHRPVGETTEIVTFSLWESMDAVRGFAGDDPHGPSTTRRPLPARAQPDRRALRRR